MKASLCRYIVLFLCVLSAGCSLSNSQVAADINNFSDIPAYEPYATDGREELADPTFPPVVSDEKVPSSPAEEEPLIAFSEKPENKAVEEKPAGIYADAVKNPLEDAAVAAEEENENNESKEQSMLDAALDYCETAQEMWSGSNPEKAIESLDEAYQLVVKVDTDKYPELTRQKEDLRFTISKRILEIYSSRYTTVNGNHKEIPLVMNEHVEKEIRSFQGYERELFIEGYKRSGKYREEIVKSLKEAGLPEELSWLPFIESWFKVTALSPARALGIWQFIPSTGYKFGLKRDTWIDERMDPRKATGAAISYLKELHKMFGDWTTVLAAYNCGEGNILRVIRSQKINYLDNFWDLYEKLPRETARYVPRFLATLYIMKDPAKYGFNLDQIDIPLTYESINIEKQIQLKAVAESLGVSAGELALLNPELRRQATPPTKYSLNVPSGQGAVLLAKLDDLPNWTPQKNEYTDYIYHTVRKGETLSRIAAKYRTNVDLIVKANKISRRRSIQIGQKLKIPLRGGKGGDLLSYKDDTMQDGKYRTKKGETLKTIALKFNSDTTRLKRLNHLTSSLLYEGQILKVTD
ncbi:MAG: LysM peptidoglycan-binding domain-containing protein [Nitrospirae bacterium]|nr:LysM peptidoglycan-binding domain-containing protein [Nitrospirota bacterium]